MNNANLGSIFIRNLEIVLIFLGFDILHLTLTIDICNNGIGKRFTNVINN